MKSAIEDHRLASQVCRWWRIATREHSGMNAAINWFHGAGSLHPDESVAEDLLFLSDTLYEKRMLP